MKLEKSKQKKLETFLKWEKKKVETQVQQILYERASEITNALVDRALQGDVSAIKESYDRMFGKATQQVDIDTGGAPIVFMPAVLVDKFGLAEPKQEPIKVEAEVIKSPISRTSSKRKVDNIN